MSVEFDDNEASAPVWASFGDLMAVLLGAFVLVLVGVIALATQVASPWCPPSRRAALARGGMSMEV